MIWTRRRFLCAASLPVLPASDEGFLEDLSRRAFLFFWEQAAVETGLTLDRTRNAGQRVTGVSEEVASLASTGFALTALCIGHSRRWRPPDEIRERVRLTLRHLANNQPHVRGWFYHFVERHTGERAWKSELSTIDTALLLAGVLTAQQYFASDGEIVRTAQEIYERVDFAWMLDPGTFCLRMGWSPESGFLRAIWGEYRENAILSLLGIASPRHPIPVQSRGTPFAGIR